MLLILFLGYFISIANAQNRDTLIVSQVDSELSFSEKINNKFEPAVDFLGSILFWDPFTSFGIYDPVVYQDNGEPFLDDDGKPVKKPIPIIVFWLIMGGIFFTFRMKFINIRAFKHSIDLVRGKYDKPDDVGEVSHFQALATAVSGTVGLGNIAGVAMAITVGGPGATFWMVIAGLFGMSSKFVEVTLGVKYRVINSNGEISGGPMYYLTKGLEKRNLGKLGKVLAVIFSILTIGAAIGGGNMFQANQSFKQFELIAPGIAEYGAWFGLVLAILIGSVILGGIKSIAKVTAKVVPFMALFYILASVTIIAIDFKELPHMFALIFNGAFSPEAIKGGILGVLIIGFQRAAFSNEAGLGSTAIAHSSVKTDEPISEGIVALLEPLIDTVVICTLTALVIIITGYHNPETAQGLDGAQLTSRAFGSVLSWFPYLLVVAILMFALSTAITWSYYGLKAFDFLFQKPIEKITGKKQSSKYIFFVIFLMFTVVGAASSMTSVMDFSDMMILSMGFPNIIGLLIMAPEVAKDLKSYLHRVNTGEIKKFK